MMMSRNEFIMQMSGCMREDMSKDRRLEVRKRETEPENTERSGTKDDRASLRLVYGRAQAAAVLCSAVCLHIVNAGRSGC